MTQNTMNQLEVHESLAPWELSEYQPYDVVWAARGCPDCVASTLAVWRSQEDAWACPYRGRTTETEPLTLYSAIELARRIGRSAVVLLDHTGKELKRWPV